MKGKLLVGFNMKYIRTKDDRIVAIPNNSKLVLYDDEKLVIDTTKKGETCIYGFIEKKADTIEELCDEFVRVSPSIHDFLVSGDIPTKKFDDTEIYGAIWCEWGLKYVARMNSEGVLELL